VCRASYSPTSSYAGSPAAKAQRVLSPSALMYTHHGLLEAAVGVVTALPIVAVVAAALGLTAATTAFGGSSPIRPAWG
jgi:FtsH-binding integral membrane protein